MNHLKPIMHSRPLNLVYISLSCYLFQHTWFI